jgi:PhnO protein
MGVSVRSCTADDFDAVYRFINELEGDTLDREVQRRIFDANLANPDCMYLIASAGGKPVGFLSCHAQWLLHHGGKVGEIQEMYVAAQARSLGVGKLLIGILKDRANTAGVIQLEVTSSFKREAAHRFYERESFIFTHKKFVYKP